MVHFCPIGLFGNSGSDPFVLPPRAGALVESHNNWVMIRLETSVQIPTQPSGFFGDFISVI